MGNQLRMLIVGNCLMLVPKLLPADMRYLSAYPFCPREGNLLDKVGESTGVCEHHAHPEEGRAEDRDDPWDILK
jgi:hypothetical protein